MSDEKQIDDFCRLVALIIRRVLSADNISET